MEEEKYIKDLKELLEEYNPNYYIYEIILSVIILFVFFAVQIFVGYILTIVLGIITIALIQKLNIKVKFRSNDNQVAYQACLIMESLIELKNSNRNPNRPIIHTISNGKNEALYKKFISLYPDMASEKLEKLSKIDIKIY